MRVDIVVHGEKARNFARQARSAGFGITPISGGFHIEPAIEEQDGLVFRSRIPKGSGPFLRINAAEEMVNKDGRWFARVVCSDKGGVLPSFWTDLGCESDVHARVSSPSSLFSVEMEAGSNEVAIWKYAIVVNRDLATLRRTLLEEGSWSALRRRAKFVPALDAVYNMSRPGAPWKLHHVKPTSIWVKMTEGGLNPLKEAAKAV